jgi:hypothetical protein
MRGKFADRANVLPSNGIASVRMTLHTYEHVANGKKESRPMANHLTPTELAREAGLDRRDVIAKCCELGVPIFNGRIDKTLFLSSLREMTLTTQSQGQVASA